MTLLGNFDTFDWSWTFQTDFYLAPEVRVRLPLLHMFQAAHTALRRTLPRGIRRSLLSPQELQIKFTSPCTCTYTDSVTDEAMI